MTSPQRPGNPKPRQAMHKSYTSTGRWAVASRRTHQAAPHAVRLHHNKSALHLACCREAIVLCYACKIAQPRRQRRSRAGRPFAHVHGIFAQGQPGQPRKNFYVPNANADAATIAAVTGTRNTCQLGAWQATPLVTAAAGTRGKQRRPAHEFLAALATPRAHRCTNMVPASEKWGVGGGRWWAA